MRNFGDPCVAVTDDTQRKLTVSYEVMSLNYTTNIVSQFRS